MPTTDEPTVESPYVKSVLAGDFVFFGGLFDARSGRDRSLGTSVMRRQSAAVFADLAAQLELHGGGLDDVVGMTQYYSAFELVSDFLDEKRRRLTRERYPTSTSVVASDLVLADQVVQIEGIAAAGGHSEVRPLIGPDNPRYEFMLKRGFSPGVEYRDWVICSGTMAADGTSTNGIGTAAEAQVDPNFWLQDQMRLEVEFILEKRIDVLLGMAGADRTNIVYADVHLIAPARDYPRFAEVWRGAFPDGAPVTSVTPAKRLGATGGLIEITILATTGRSGLRLEPIDVPGVPRPLGEFPIAGRAGDYVFTGTLSAAEDDGTYRPSYRLGSRFEDRHELEAGVVVDRLEQVCVAAGGSLDSVVKARLPIADLDRLPAVSRPWRERVAGAPLSIVGHAEADWIDGCTMTAHAIAHIPRASAS